jgi:hypothetical protein
MSYCNTVTDLGYVRVVGSAPHKGREGGLPPYLPTTPQAYQQKAAEKALALYTNVTFSLLTEGCSLQTPATDKKTQ